VTVLATAGIATAATSPLKGAYETVIKGQKGQLAALNGAWIISFAGNGAYAVVEEPKTSTLLIGGLSTATSKTVVFHDKTGPLACAATGSYTWSHHGKTYKFTKVKDTCAGRAAVLTTSTFVKG
jgi:hypothetical protein